MAALEAVRQMHAPAPLAAPPSTAGFTELCSAFASSPPTVHSLQQLRNYYAVRGRPYVFDRLPFSGATLLDIHRLWAAVQAHGGSGAITDANKWSSVAEVVLGPAVATTANAEFFVRATFVRYLADFEDHCARQHPSTPPQVLPRSFDPRKSMRAELAAKRRPPRRHDRPELEDMARAVQSGLQTEVEWALQALLRRSADPDAELLLHQSPALIRALAELLVYCSHNNAVLFHSGAPATDAAWLAHAPVHVRALHAHASMLYPHTRSAVLHPPHLRAHWALVTAGMLRNFALSRDNRESMGSEPLLVWILAALSVCRVRTARSAALEALAQLGQEVELQLLPAAGQPLSAWVMPTEPDGTGAAAKSAETAAAGVDARATKRRRVDAAPPTTCALRSSANTAHATLPALPARSLAVVAAVAHRLCEGDRGSVLLACETLAKLAGSPRNAEAMDSLPDRALQRLALLLGATERAGEAAEGGEEGDDSVRLWPGAEEEGEAEGGRDDAADETERVLDALVRKRGLYLTTPHPSMRGGEPDAELRMAATKAVHRLCALGGLVRYRMARAPGLVLRLLGLMSEDAAAPGQDDLARLAADCVAQLCAGASCRPLLLPFTEDLLLIASREWPPSGTTMSPTSLTVSAMLALALRLLNP